MKAPALIDTTPVTLAADAGTYWTVKVEDPLAASETGSAGVMSVMPGAPVTVKDEIVVAAVPVLVTCTVAVAVCPTPGAFKVTDPWEATAAPFTDTLSD